MFGLLHYSVKCLLDPSLAYPLLETRAFHVALLSGVLALSGELVDVSERLLFRYHFDFK